MASHVAVKFYSTDESGTALDPLPTLVHAPQATNYYLNNRAPVTQTINGLTGTHTAWLEGTGSVTLSGGLTGVVTAGSPITGDPAGVGVVCTLSGTPDFVQVEDNVAPTMPIWTEGAALTRDEDNYSFDVANANDTQGCWLINVEPTLDNSDFFATSPSPLSLLYRRCPAMEVGASGRMSAYDSVSAHSVINSGWSAAPMKIAVKFGDGKIQLTADGVSGSEDAYSGDLGGAGIFDLALGDSSNMVLYYGEIQYNNADYDTAGEIIDAWMVE